MSKRYWWPTASEEDRLVQVKAAAEIGLTKGEAAILLGAKSYQAISYFAKAHDIDFSNADKGHAIRRATKHSVADGRDYTLRILKSKFERYCLPTADLALADHRSEDAQALSDGFSMLEDVE